MPTYTAMAPRLSLVASLVALVLAGPAGARPGPVPIKQPVSPQGLKAFLLRADEPAGHTFSRTPSFAWHPVRAAVRYEFELATSARFTDNAVLWSATDLTSPVASIPIALPWITGNPYSLWAHVRAITRKGVTQWSAPYGFNMRWASVPTPMSSDPGLVRWTPVAGATQYNVWFVDVGKVFTTMTNVADEREYYSFHNDSSWTGAVHWRVRPERYLYGSTTNGLPAISFGPWSPVYTSYNPPFAVGPLSPVAAVSDTTSDALAPKPHRLMPGFAFTGNVGVGGTGSMFRVYIATDRDCLNIVYRGAIVGSPAYAPRPTGPLALPHDHAGVLGAENGYLKDGDEGTSYMSDGFSFASSEVATSNGVNPWWAGIFYAVSAFNNSGMALLDAGALAELSGRVVLFAVPAEEYVAVVNPAKALALTTVDLLASEAREARRVVALHRPAMTRDAYLAQARSLLREERYRAEA